MTEWINLEDNVFKVFPIKIIYSFQPGQYNNLMFVIYLRNQLLIFFVAIKKNPFLFTNLYRHFCIFQSVFYLILSFGFFQSGVFTAVIVAELFSLFLNGIFPLLLSRHFLQITCSLHFSIVNYSFSYSIFLW